LAPAGACRYSNRSVSPDLTLISCVWWRVTSVDLFHLFFCHETQPICKLCHVPSQLWVRIHPLSNLSVSDERVKAGVWPLIGRHGTENRRKFTFPNSKSNHANDVMTSDRFYHGWSDCSLGVRSPHFRTRVVLKLSQPGDFPVLRHHLAILATKRLLVTKSNARVWIDISFTLFPESVDI
jgi:hypothetical protein